MPIPKKSKVTIKFKKLKDGVLLPTRVHDSDAGFDIFLPVTLKAFPGGSFKIPLGFASEIPEGYYGRITSRGSAFTEGLNIVGTVDSGYRGEWILFIQNISKTTVITHVGDRIAQVIFHKIPEVLVEVVDELSDTDRGDGALGSTGA